MVLQAATVQAQPPAVIDQVALLPDPSLPPAPTQATVPVALSLAADRHFISPLIYGMAFAPPDYLADLRLPVNRWGGNDKSRYDWVQGNAENAAADWGFRDRYATDGSVPPGTSSAADRFVRQDAAAGAATLLTVPTLGWVARDADNAHASQNVPGHGGAPLQGADGPIAGYDPAGTAPHLRPQRRPQRGAVRGRPDPGRRRGLPGRVGASPGPHVRRRRARRRRPVRDGQRAGPVGQHSPGRPPGPPRLRRPAGRVPGLRRGGQGRGPDGPGHGPRLSGWTGYEFSPLDRGDDNYHAHADQDRHGGEWLLPWFLRQVRDHDRRTGRRTLDVLDVHFYPQGQGLYGPQDDTDAQARRLRSVRALWDPAYTDESWIGTPVRLIPRLRDWVAQDYPGTRLGITEWSFGADQCMDGGLATADALGVFGREGVFLADYWAYPNKDDPAYLAFKLYRNADGQGHGFGDASVRAASAAPDRLAAYAATDTRTGDLTVMLINKMPRAAVTAPLTGLPPGAAAVKMWRVSADNPKQVVALPAVPVVGAALTLRLPPYSMTLLRTQTARTQKESP